MMGPSLRNPKTRFPGHLTHTPKIDEAAQANSSLTSGRTGGRGWLIKWSGCTGGGQICISNVPPPPPLPGVFVILIYPVPATDYSALTCGYICNFIYFFYAHRTLPSLMLALFLRTPISRKAGEACESRDPGAISQGRSSDVRSRVSR